jgi:hypothetical protein
MSQRAGGLRLTSAGRRSALVERNGARNTRIEISNPSARKRRFLNAPITLSVIDEFSCANGVIRRSLCNRAPIENFAIVLGDSVGRIWSCTMVA